MSFDSDVSKSELFETEDFFTNLNDNSSSLFSFDNGLTYSTPPPPPTPTPTPTPSLYLGNHIVVDGLNVNFGNSTLHNVADGLSPSDAINLKQLNNYVGSVTLELNALIQSQIALLKYFFGPNYPGHDNGSNYYLPESIPSNHS